MHGDIEGTLMISRKGKVYDAFLRIPFAEPPIGTLRFQPPLKKEAWSEVLNATAYVHANSRKRCNVENE